MKKVINLVIVSVSILFLASCGTSKTTSFSDDQLEELKQMVDYKPLEFNLEWANPLVTTALASIGNSGLIQPGSTINRIDLTGTNAYVKIEGDSIKADLPYYGEQQMPRSYGGRDNGILLDGPMTNIVREFNPDKDRYELRFQANQQQESYQVIIFIFPNNTTRITINSSHRTNISYGGVLKSTEES